VCAYYWLWLVTFRVRWQSRAERFEEFTAWKGKGEQRVKRCRSGHLLKTLAWSKGQWKGRGEGTPESREAEDWKDKLVSRDGPRHSPGGCASSPWNSSCCLLVTHPWHI
jgi:hypothetical protein